MRYQWGLPRLSDVNTINDEVVKVVEVAKAVTLLVEDTSAGPEVHSLIILSIHACCSRVKPEDVVGSLRPTSDLAMS